MNVRRLTFLQIAAVIYCLIFSYNLTEAWRFAPLERGSWIPLLIWSVPVFAYRLGILDPRPTTETSNALLLIGILSTFMGIIGTVHTLKNIGLACTLASLLPLTPVTILWLISSIAWMRPTGWLGSRFFTDYLLYIRILIVFVPTEWLMLHLNKARHETDYP